MDGARTTRRDMKSWEGQCCSYSIGKTREHQTDSSFHDGNQGRPDLMKLWSFVLLLAWKCFLRSWLLLANHNESPSHSLPGIFISIYLSRSTVEPLDFHGCKCCKFIFLHLAIFLDIVAGCPNWLCHPLFPGLDLFFLFFSAEIDRSSFMGSSSISRCISHWRRRRRRRRRMVLIHKNI